MAEVSDRQREVLDDLRAFHRMLGETIRRMEDLLNAPDEMTQGALRDAQTLRRQHGVANRDFNELFES